MKRQSLEGLYECRHLQVHPLPQKIATREVEAGAGAGAVAVEVAHIPIDGINENCLHLQCFLTCKILY